MTWEDARAIAHELPAVQDSAEDGYPALRVAGKVLMRLGLDAATVMFKGLSAEERELLTGARPDTFYVADGGLSARLATLPPSTLRGLLKNRWLALMPPTAAA